MGPCSPGQHWGRPAAPHTSQAAPAEHRRPSGQLPPGLWTGAVAAGPGRLWSARARPWSLGEGWLLSAPACRRAQLRRWPGSREGHPVRPCCQPAGPPVHLVPRAQPRFPHRASRDQTPAGPTPTQRGRGTFTAVCGPVLPVRSGGSQFKVPVSPGPDPPPTHADADSPLPAWPALGRPLSPELAPTQAPARPLPRLLARLPGHRAGGSPGWSRGRAGGQLSPRPRGTLPDCTRAAGP